ncbi:hypothetical protein PoB_000893700 [Plakobranchus ocellatus]|uniref:Uncharacterized protein n=1 Tax=Plakobranchus ocellatus TaxID=259542 RepID=A0AAV3YJQ5_9GAST|nr:hypothetical protein PoB_000893700 [Plakobranchus ocellatus]
MPQPSKIPPHGVKKQQLGLGVLGAHCYFRLRLSKLSRLAKRCLTLSAALLALCAWLCLITVMNVAPLQQNAQLEKGTTAAAVVKEDANFFIRSGELFDNRGSYPGFPHAPNGYLSPIDMRFKREKIGGNKEEKAQLMNVVIEERNQKGNRKAITNAGPTIAKGIITHGKEKFKLSNIDYDIKSSGVGSRLIQGFKVTEPRELEASFPRSKENSEIWSRLRSDKNRNDNDVTSYSRRLSSPSPYPTITTFQNQAPVPLFPFQHRSGRRREIDNGPITITRIRSSRQAPRNPLPNLAPEKEVDNGGNDIPKHSCLKHVMLDKKIRDSSDLVYNDISFQTSPTHLDNKNSQTSAPLQSEKLSARGLEELKKSINTRWLSGESEKQLNRQSNFYDDRKGTNGINRLSLSNGSYKNAQKIEANTVDTYSGLQRRVLELHNSHSQTIPLVGSGSNLPTEGERIGAERVTSQKPGIPGDNEVTVSSFRPISFHSTTSVRKIRGTAEFGGKRRATSGVKSGIKYPNHSTTRRRQNYKGVQGIRDGPSPQGSQPTVVRFHATSSRTRSNLTLGENSGNCTNIHCPRRETDKTVDLVYNGNFTGKQESAKSPARYLQFALIHNKTQLEKNLKQSFRDYKSLNMWNTTYKETGVLHNDGFDVYSYNVTASNAIPLDRNIPDTRPPGASITITITSTINNNNNTTTNTINNTTIMIILHQVSSLSSSKLSLPL